MANLIGYVEGNKGRASRVSPNIIGATLETWHGQITVNLKKDGEFDIYIGPKGSHGMLVASGNVDEGKRKFVLEDNLEGTTGSAIH